MNCRQVQHLLSDQLENVVPERAAGALEAHLTRCLACRRLQAEWQSARAELRELARQVPLPDSDIDHRAIDYWLAERATAGKAPRRWFLTALTASRPARFRCPQSLAPRSAPMVWSAGAAVLLLAILALFGWNHARVGTLRRPMMAARPGPAPAAPVLPSGPRPPRQTPGRRTASLPSAQRNRAGEIPPSFALEGQRDISPATHRWEPAVGTPLVRARPPAPEERLKPVVHPRYAPGDSPEERRALHRPPLPVHRRAPIVDDLVYVNRDPRATFHQWVPLSRNEWEALAARVRHVSQVRDDFVNIPFPRLVDASNQQIAAEVERFKREAAIVDPRLSREVTLAFKATALADLCERLRTDTSIHLAAGPSVADEKVTIFCEKQPLRDVMRQLSRPFGYTWLRSKKEGEYRYELVQDLRSQLMEEELRNRDRNQALLALEKETDRYRQYLGLSPDQALERAKSAAPDEKALLERLAQFGWGPLQLYFRLSPQEQAALRAGQRLVFSAEPKPGELPLPPDLAQGTLQGNRRWHVIKLEKGFDLTPDLTDPRGQPFTAVPEARAKAALELHQSELGVFTLSGQSGAFIASGPGTMDSDGRPYAIGLSPAVTKPQNGVVNARLARDASLRARISVRPRPDLSWTTRSASGAPPSLARGGGSREALAQSPRDRAANLSPAREGQQEGADRELERIPGFPRLPSAAPGGGGEEPSVTSADVLEALHQATGMPIVSDFYTRLYPAAAVSVQKQSLFDALNQLADTMRLRWNKDAGGGTTAWSGAGPRGEAGAWLQLRSTSFYDDRLKEVPNRLLARWAAARQQHSALTLDDLVEIVQLPNAQLDAREMAEGARKLWDLAEWDVARSGMQRPHLRYLAEFTPAQRQEMMGAAGFPFAKMSLPQQQKFMAYAFQHLQEPLQSLEELEGATLRVDYTVPGWFQWKVPGPAWLQWTVQLEPERAGRRVLLPPIRERTRDAALAAARRIDPRLREAMTQVLRRSDPRSQATMTVDESEIVPTRPELTIVYIPGLTNRRPLHIFRAGQDLTSGAGM